jgi:hypothetical protein
MFREDKYSIIMAWCTSTGWLKRIENQHEGLPARPFGWRNTFLDAKKLHFIPAAPGNQYILLYCFDNEPIVCEP